MDDSHVVSRVVALLFLALALVGCNVKTPFSALAGVAPRPGGGAFVTGSLTEYDGLSERDETSYVRVEVDDTGQIVGRKNVGTPDRTTPTALAFGDGTTLDVLPSPPPLAPADEPGPLTVRGLDPQGAERWRTTLDLAGIGAFCTDAGGVDGNGTLILAGPTAQPTDGASRPNGTIVLALTADGSTIWQRTITEQ